MKRVMIGAVLLFAGTALYCQSQTTIFSQAPATPATQEPFHFSNSWLPSTGGSAPIKAHGCNGPELNQSESNAEADLNRPFQIPCLEVTPDPTFNRLFKIPALEVTPHPILIARNENPLFLPQTLWPHAKGEPIPTRWPNARIEQIPTEWPNLRMQNIAGSPRVLPK